MRLNERVAVVTGAGSGIGRAVARRFAAEGAAVMVVDRVADAVDETVAMIAAAGGRAIGRVSDVGEPGAAEADVAWLRSHWPRLDVLVCAAGFSCGGTVTSTPLADWDAVFRANVGGTWLWARAAIPVMQAGGGGSIINFASQLAIAGGRGNSAYIAAKGAIISLTRTMALDYAADGIRVNAIAPGAIDTPMLARGFGRQPDPAAAREASRRRHALARFGTVDEVAASVLHLASDESGFVTGVVLPVDGGWLAA